jgi:membrane fusion protein (multidrug efflux system)
VDPASGAALRPGLSVEVKVDLKSRGGLSFAQAATGTIATAAADTGARAQ